MSNSAAAANAQKRSFLKKKELAPAPAHRKPLGTRLKENWQLYLLLLIPVIITVIYKYGPMYGIQIAFRDFTASRGIWGSEWVAFEWFERFFSSPNCGRMIVNTVLISLYSLLWSFPVPIILALALNQLRFHKLKRVVQTVLYAPHFISTMIICGMLRIFLSPSGGLINLLLGFFVGVGSRHERRQDNGAAHFIEHMLFKGTDRRSAAQLARDMDAIGGTFGAMAPEAPNLIEAIKMTFATGGANNFWIIIGIVVSFLIMIMGVSGGIEKSCKIMIPALYVLFIALAVLMIFTPGTAEGYKYIFSINWEGFLNPQVWVYAFGQCFFSLSVAGSGSVVYGSYLGDDVKIRQSAVICAIMDTSAALLAMLIIIPAMSTVGADLGNGGPGLMFIYVLPVFNNMGAIARLIVIFFYVAILFAGVSSVINLFETPINFLQEQLHMKRITATAIIHVVGLIVALMIQPWTSQWMDTVSIYVLPLGALTAGIMFFWVMKKDTAIAAAQLGSDKPIMKWFMPFGKYVFVPLCIACFVLGIAWGGIG